MRNTSMSNTSMRNTVIIMTNMKMMTTIMRDTIIIMMNMKMMTTDIMDIITITTIIMERVRQKNTVSEVLYIIEENLLLKKNLKTGLMICLKVLSEAKVLSGQLRTIMTLICLNRQVNRLILQMPADGMLQHQEEYVLRQ